MNDGLDLLLSQFFIGQGQTQIFAREIQNLTRQYVLNEGQVLLSTADWQNVAFLNICFEARGFPKQMQEL